MKKFYFFILAFFLLSAFQSDIIAEQRSSISQYNITWYFNGNYECGQFVTGDWWVVGPVTINSISPAQSPGTNGSCVNPMPGRQGYDDRSYPGNIYSTADRISYPATLNANQSLVSSISRSSVEKNFGNLQSQAILTVVSSAQPAGTFRPAYCGSYKKYFNVSQLNMSVLPTVPRPSNALNAAQLVDYTDRPRVDHLGNWTIQYGCAEDNWNNGIAYGVEKSKCYGQQYSQLISEAAMHLMMDIPERTELAYNMIQYGIDNYGVLRAGGKFAGDGGHYSGRKFPIVFAAVLLGDPDMMNVGQDYVSRKFGENDQTYFNSSGKALWGRLVSDYCWYYQGCTGDDCGGSKDVADPDQITDGCPTYRDRNTSRTWVGQALATLFIGGKSVWGYDAYFDYMDRWMNGDVEGAGIAHADFINDMWDLYRDDLPQGGEAIMPTGVSLTPTTVTLDEGLSQQLTETVLPANATSKTVTWSSNNSAVATVSSSGMVSAVSPGTATITVTTLSGGFTTTCNVTVNSIGTNVALNKSITVSDFDIASDKPGENLVDGDVSDDARWSASGFPQWAEIDLGADYDLSRIDVYPYENRPYQYIIEGKTEGGSYTTIVNRSSNTESADNLYDNVTTSARYLKITVSGISGNTSSWVSLSELKAYVSGAATSVDGVSLNPTVLNIDEGQTSSLTATISPSNATNQSVTYISNNTAIATVNASGVVTGVNEGNATITVTTVDGGFTANCSVTVNDVPAPAGNVFYCSPSGSMSNSGTSTSSPWASLEDVFDANKTFTAGDVIYLMDGNHGGVTIEGNNSGAVTITAASGANPEVDYIILNAATNWVFDGITISPDFQPDDVPDVTYLVKINGNSTYNTIKNCDLYSTLSSASWTEADWSANAWSGFDVDGAHNTIKNNNIKNIRWGMRIDKAADYTLAEYNEMENIMNDAIQTLANYCTYQYNTFKNMYAIDGNHDDFLQSYSMDDNWNVGVTTVYANVVRGNVFISCTDPNQPFKSDAQGIGNFDGMFEDWIVENNLIIVDMWHGLSFYGAKNCTIVNNTVLKNPIDAYGMTPWIYVDNHKNGTPSTGNVVKNNIASDLEINSTVGNISNNIQTTNYATYFADYANFDYHLAVNSPVIDAGTSTGAPAIDLDGVSRPQGSAYDIGCYEYGGAFISVSDVTLAPTTLALDMTQTSQLTATVIPANATNKNVSWSSNNTSVADVDDNGLVTAISVGQATITVTTGDGGFTAICTVTVAEPTSEYNLAFHKNITVSDYQDDSYGVNPGSNLVDGITSDASRWAAENFPQWAEIDLGSDCNITQFELYTYQGRDYQYIIEAKTDGGSYTTVVDRSANTDGSQPIIDAVSTSARYVKITVSGANTYTGSWMSLNELKVIGTTNTTIVDVTGVSVSPTTLNLDPAQTSDLTETVSPANATDQSVVWSSSNDAIATVDANGVVSALSGGQATITVTTNDGNYTATCDVTVNTPIISVTGVTISASSLTLDVNETSDLDETVNPTDATNKTVVWSSSNETAATVDANGVVSALSGGQATITVATNDGNFTATCDVTVKDASQPTITTLNPVDDATVRGGTSEDNNYGTQTTLTVKNASLSYTRESFIKFDLSAIANPVSSAILRLYMSEAGNGVDVHTISLVSDDTWTETGITYANKPATGSAITSWNVTTAAEGTYIELAITSAAISEAGGLLSLHITSNDGDYVLYDSKEATNKPELIVTTTGSSTISVTGVSVSSTSVTLNEGQTYDLDETVSPTDATDKSVVWSTSDSNIATVDANGLITAVSVGNATITVTTNDGGITATCNVTVLRPVTGVSVSTASLTLDEGQTSDLNETITPSGASDNSVVWSTSDSNVATVDANGLVTAVSVGNTTITVTTNDGGYTATCDVTVLRPVTGVTVSSATLTLDEGQTSDLNETITPSGASDNSVVWSTSDSNIATVDANGLVTAISDGNVTITVTTNDGGYTATCDVTVNAIPVYSNIALNKAITVSAYQDDSYGFNPGGNLVDGDVSDDARWSAGGFPQWAEIDLGGNYDLTHINLFPYQNRAYQYTIEAKTSGGSYVTIVDRSSNTVSADMLTDNVNSTARFVKITVSGLSGNTSTWVSLAELEVYGIEAAPVPVTGVNISSSSLTLDVDETSDLDETVNPTDAADKTVVWSSSNTSIATVDANGLVTAISAGTATITVTTNDGGYTATCDVTVNDPQPTVTTLNPVADAYVRGGSYDDYNYGTGSTLTVKDAVLTNTRESYIKFDLSGITNPVTSAVLRLYLAEAGVGSDIHTISLVSNDSWTENGITYTNKPSVGSAITSWNIATADEATYIEIDITSAAISEAGGLLTLHIASNGGDYVYYDSREASNKPELVITSGGGAKNKTVFKSSNSGEFKFKVYPNPVTTDYFKIEFEGNKNSSAIPNNNQNVTISIVDMTGRLVYTNEISNNKVRQQYKVACKTPLKNGIYLISVSDITQKVVRKLIVE